MSKILIVDDEESINDLIAMSLQLVGYEYAQAYDGKEALEFIKNETFDLTLLDIMLPIIDGYELIHHFQKKEIPVIFLTAKDSLLEKVKGLRLGADDYITKPFESLELIARIESVLRRTGKNNDTFKLNDISVNLKERTVTKSGIYIDLTAQEFSLLEVLILNCNLALSREKLLEEAWGYDYVGETRTVDMHIQRLRKKLNLENNIKTIFKYGYRLEK